MKTFVQWVEQLDEATRLSQDASPRGPMQGTASPSAWMPGPGEEGPKHGPDYYSGKYQWKDDDEYFDNILTLDKETFMRMNPRMDDFDYEATKKEARDRHFGRRRGAV